MEITKPKRRFLRFSLRTLLLLMLVVVPFPGLTADGQVTEQRRAIVHEVGEKHVLLVLHAPWRYGWFVLPKSVLDGSEIRAETHFGKTTRVSSSPDGKFLAVVSSGEGYDCLQVVELAALIQNHHWKVIGDVSGYAGSLQESVNQGAS